MVRMYLKSIDTVLPDMTMGWRTSTVPNGTYDIFMTTSVAAGNYSLKAESNHVSVTVSN